MSAATCDSINLKKLITEIKGKITDDILNTKMIEHLEDLNYDDDLDFISLVIGRIINEKQIDISKLTNLTHLQECVTNKAIVNCDILLLGLLQSAATLATDKLQEFINECVRNYPKLSYHLKMRIQYVLYKNIYKISDSPLNTEKLRKEFVNFFDKRCLNAQYRNILYSKENEILNEIDGIDNDVKFNDFKNKLKESMFNEETNNTKDPKFTNVVFDNYNSFNTNKDKLKTLFQEKMKIMGGYNNKQGNLTYHLCSSSVNISLKKVQAKTAREGAKIMARKLLNKSGNKLVKFSLKRMIGKKEKYYNYQASIDKSGKISIKST